MEGMYVDPRTHNKNYDLEGINTQKSLWWTVEVKATREG